MEPWTAVSIHSTTSKPTLMQESKSRGGVSLKFLMLEPVVYLQGDGKNDHHTAGNTALLRGNIQMHVTQPTRVKSFSLSFCGKALVSPFGKNTRTHDLINSSITYLEDGQGIWTDLVSGCSIPRNTIREELVGKRRNSAPAILTRPTPPPEYDPPSYERLERIHSSETSRTPSEAQARGRYATIPAGDHTFPFEFVVLNSLPQTIDTQLLSTRYFLEAKVEFGGLFGSKLISQLDVPLLRLPPESSWEWNEPVTLTRNWSENLQYHFAILGRSFCLGSQIPIRMGLVPLVGLTCSSVQVLMLQHIRYWDRDKETCLVDSGKRTVLLLEKSVDAECRSVFPGGDVRISKDQEKGELADKDDSSLLGGLMQPCQIEMDVQLPRCYELKERLSWQRVHSSSKIGTLDVSHWIQVVLRFRLTDKEDGNITTEHSLSQRLTLQAPITIRSCKATASNIYVPQYRLEQQLETESLRNSTCDCQSSSLSPESLTQVEKLDEPEREGCIFGDPNLPDVASPILKSFSPSVTLAANTEQLGT
ncbi:hypothetical protein N7539_006193 [Penicillium diatomitis]|uniref:Arrestin C-terminal-like domain-containing protein n=1 Tax=Penicillium diatomitis TaxID=2819901 RepID=A0A9W9X2N6_9EURO|nr:uncharacterized protein N7539_006193 [Penicillium diatomitis]KAJ5482747.1 hypothetical protein N7539_006193 [Penicillium diatomitis]